MPRACKLILLLIGWVSFVLKKREHIISLVKKRNARYLKRNQQFGIDLPKNVEEARILDEKMATMCGQMPLLQRWKMLRLLFRF